MPHWGENLGNFMQKVKEFFVTKFGGDFCEFVNLPRKDPTAKTPQIGIVGFENIFIAR